MTLRGQFSMAADNRPTVLDGKFNVAGMAVQNRVAPMNACRTPDRTGGRPGI
jgi:hypothetical protein